MFPERILGNCCYFLLYFGGYGFSSLSSDSKAMNSVYLANFMAVVVLVDAYCTVVDIDATAAREKSPEVFRWISDLCLAARPCRVLRGVEVTGPGR